MRISVIPKTKTSSKILCILIAWICLILIGGCKSPQQQSFQFQSNQKDKEIRELKKRLKNIEDLIKSSDKQILREPLNNPEGPIKSITFRLGTEDDRLRIYWEDGSKSDLPCTKEQFIWVCG